MNLWALNDRGKGAPHLVTEPEARQLNQDGFGIFHTVNEHTGARKASNLTRINYWFVDLDEGKKQSQLRRLENASLVPTRVIESANGYHAYWAALNATQDNWKKISKGLVQWLGADPKATDPLRLLRVPGYYHNKSAEEPFLVTDLWHCPWYAYLEKQMLEAFPYKEPERRPTPLPQGGDGPWHVDARIGIPALNGHSAMGGESFELRPTSKGTHNIIRLPDEYSTGCWVDEDGYIGGNHKGSTLGAWMAWYGTEREDILAAIEEVKRGIQSKKS